jgi:hypothetical protein
MTQRLIRVFLALAVAFVFTGRMEAAAAHCARLAHADDAAAPAPETAPCHGSNAAEADKPAPQPKHHDKSTDPCECLAVLKACTVVVAATASVHIEPYKWVRPEAIAFASTEPSPALRPPRA